jgi:hypothetical protein
MTPTTPYRSRGGLNSSWANGSMTSDGQGLLAFNAVIAVSSYERAYAIAILTADRFPRGKP